MSVILRVLLIVFSILAIIYCIYKIRKSKMKTDYSLFWIFFSVILLIMSIIPGLPMMLSRILGIVSPANFIFLLMIFLLIFYSFFLTLKLSKIEDTMENIAEELAITKKELSDSIEKNDIDKDGKA